MGSKPEIYLYRAIGTKCVELGCSLCAIGGTADHVHLLSRLHPSISVARWQGGYSAFSISLNNLPAVESYVRHQKQHHDRL
jgi:putative transposase